VAPSTAQEVVTTARATGRIAHAAAAAATAAAVAVTIRNVAAGRHRHHENNTVHRATSDKIGENNPHA
jgi:hypothetical protein